jgi:hypothetical protein
MNTIKTILSFYLFGIVVTLLLIGFIYLYSFLFEPHFCYAEWDNMLLTTLICGIPFGIAVWGFKKFKK